MGREEGSRLQGALERRTDEAWLIDQTWIKWRRRSEGRRPERPRNDTVLVAVSLNDNASHEGDWTLSCRKQEATRISWLR